jgi:formate dehydrogenase major subunit
MGSNMAECHPVGFQWVVEAKLRGATVIHVDPRFTRTSASAHLHVQVRPGTDIAFLGGVIRYVIEHDRAFREYVVAYTNAAELVSEDFRDTEDLDGLFSGWDAEAGVYDTGTWRLTGERDETLTHPRCVYQVLRRHFSRYTPDVVERITGVPAAQLERVARALCDNSGRERTSAVVYSVGWTQHTVGVQNVRAAAILQLLLGNVGRPGGGIMALRGHASIQGSTDIPTLYNLLPGYLAMPHAARHPDLAAYVAAGTTPAGWWGRTGAFTVSLLRAWFGDAATAENDYGFDLLPRITGDHSTYPTFLAMLDGQVEGFFALGENPAVGSANSRLHRLALAKLDWLVVRDLVEIETASFWKDAPELATGELRTEDIGTEVFLMPAAAHTEKDGTFTNTQRLLQWHHAALEPEGDRRSELWFFYHLGRRIRERLAGSAEPRDRALRALTWDYPTSGPVAEPSAEAVLAEINGRDADGAPLRSFAQLKDDGSTACGCWIYCGSYADGVNQPARRRPGREQSWVAPEWGWSWPANRRLLYNRASADPQGRPWSERKRYVWWDAERGRWTGEDVPDIGLQTAPDYLPPPGARADLALPGSRPFIMQADGLGWLFAPRGLADGPLPAHYEPFESPAGNPLYEVAVNPTARVFDRPRNRRNRDGDRYPFVLTTYRLTEHHTAGGMSRFLPFLSELQPEMFCEVSPELAAERGLVNGGWAVVVTERSAIETRVLVTRRVRPMTVGSRVVHQVGLPYHWGSRGLARGASANDLLVIVADPNANIQESKVATCDIRPGRLGERHG